MSALKFGESRFDTMLLYSESARNKPGEWVEMRFAVAPAKSPEETAAIYQDLVDHHGFIGAYNSVKRFARKLRHREPEQFDRLAFLPGGDELLSIATDRTVRRWDLATGAGTVLAEYANRPLRLTVAPNGGAFAVKFDADAVVVGSAGCGRGPERYVVHDVDGGDPVHVAVAVAVAVPLDPHQMSRDRHGRP